MSNDAIDNPEEEPSPDDANGGDQTADGDTGGKRDIKDVALPMSLTYSLTAAAILFIIKTLYELFFCVC